MKKAKNMSERLSKKNTSSSSCNGTNELRMVLSILWVVELSRYGIWLFTDAPKELSIIFSANVKDPQ